MTYILIGISYLLILGLFLMFGRFMKDVDDRLKQQGKESH